MAAPPALASSRAAQPEGQRWRPRSLLDLLGRGPQQLLPLGLFGCAFLVYLLLRPPWEPLYIHFVYQADSWLHGRAAIPFPVWQPPHANYYYQDVMPLPETPGYGLIPYPPLPALVMLPFVALYGLDAPQALIGVILGATNVALAWGLAWRLTGHRTAALLATLFFGFGTVAWYASMIGSTWFFAHVVALSVTLLALTVAIGQHPPSPGSSVDSAEKRLFVAGLLLGLGGLARLTVVLGAPFLVLAGSGPLWRRALAVAAGVGIPVGGLLVYNLATAGALLHPAYAYAASTELHPVPELYHPDWGLEDLRYIPQNLVLALGLPPSIRPECGLRLFDPACPTIAPNPLGMSLILVSPAYLLAVPFAWQHLERPLVRGAVLAVAAIGLADLAHFSQGWVQFGYRFSNDWAPFALVLVALAIAHRGADRVVLALVGISMAMNIWGVCWGIMSGW
jgi:hypothetical protein